MSYDFINRFDYQDLMNISLLGMGGQLSPEDVARITQYRKKWNFYEGFHWQDLPPTGKTEVTKNYCRAFVNKFVAFELGKGFSIKMKPDVEEVVLPFLNEVWEDNNKLKLCQGLGQMKSVTGDGWFQVSFEPKFNEDGSVNTNFDDPYNEYENGRIRILVVPSNIVFPVYNDGYDKDKLSQITIMYPIRQDPTKPNTTKTIVYKQIWTKDTVEVWYGSELAGTYKNKYGVIPFFHCKNLEMAGRNFGLSDLEDLIPLNMELNLKSSDVSEIIEYHSAPVTLVYGARVGQLEKGANKVWGGLPKDAKVENLTMQSDLQASKEYIATVKKAMHEIGCIPENALGGDMAISNTSGVALQVIMMPLIEKVQMKRALTAECLAKVNKLIIKIGLEEGIIKVSDTFKKGDTYAKDLYQNEILFEDNLPKDTLVEVQTLQLEMKLGLADREEGMKRLGKEDIQQRLAEIDKDRAKYPEIYGMKDQLDEDLQQAQIDATEQGIKTQQAQVKMQKEQGKNVMTRPLNTNKAGNDSQVNSGYTNSPKKQQSTNS